MEREAPELIGQLPFLSGRRSDGVAQVNVVMFVAMQSSSTPYAPHVNKLWNQENIVQASFSSDGAVKPTKERGNEDSEMQ